MSKNRDPYEDYGDIGYESAIPEIAIKGPALATAETAPKTALSLLSSMVFSGKSNGKLSVSARTAQPKNLQAQQPYDPNDLGLA